MPKKTNQQPIKAKGVKPNTGHSPSLAALLKDKFHSSIASIRQEYERELSLLDKQLAKAKAASTKAKQTSQAAKAKYAKAKATSKGKTGKTTMLQLDKARNAHQDFQNGFKEANNSYTTLNAQYKELAQALKEFAAIAKSIAKLEKASAKKGKKKLVRKQK